MEAETREERGDKRAWAGSAGQSSMEKAQRMEDQPEERAKSPAPDWSIQGGEAYNPGLDHSGDSAQRPGLEHLGRGQETRRRPPGLEHLQGCGAKKRHKLGLEHPGNNKKASRRAPWTGATGGLRTKAPNRIFRG